MDFNINNETFANAYKCLNDAVILLESGLGNFNEWECIRFNREKWYFK